jgi:sugar transferase (PEP-CTERM system associated)
MVRIFKVYFPGRILLLVLTEAVLIALAQLVAMFAWFGSDTELALIYDNGVAKASVPFVLCILCMYYYDLYDSSLLSNGREAVVRLVQVLGTVCVVSALAYYAFPPLQLARVPFVLGIILAGVALFVWRRLFVSLNRSERLAERVALVGCGSLATDLPLEVNKRAELGFTMVGYLGTPTSAAPDLLRNLGSVDELKSVVKRERIDRLMVALSDRRGSLPVWELLDLKARGLRVQDGAEVYEAITGKVHLDSLRPSWFLFSDGFRVSRFILSYKRAASLVLSVVGLILAAPVMLLVAIAIKLDSPGPAIFRQKRVGVDGLPFTVFKFRSMIDNADGGGSVRPATAEDARITRVGHYIRKLRLDELPQLLNILRGDMYFIGPRPFTPNLEAELAAAIPFYSQRSRIRPGATGWAQVNRGYCESIEDNAEKLAYDLFYIRNMSIGLDCLILFQTIKILLLGRGGR